MVTIKDLAKMAGVSHTTVSRALNDSAMISEETKAYIKRLAKENRYVVNNSAKSLKLNRAFTIGIFFSYLDEGTNANFFQKSLVGASKALENRYNMVVRETENFDQFDTLHQKNFDGILLISQTEKDKAFIEQVKLAGLPIVVVNRDFQDDRLCTFVSDEVEGSFQATQYLIDQGHENIATIIGKPDFMNTQLRLKGYEKAMTRAGYDYKMDQIVSGQFTYSGGYHAMKTLLQLSHRPTAVFCQNDEMAIGAIKAAVECGLKVPDHLAIMGYDEIEMSQFVSPALTTVSRHMDEITNKAAEHLMAMIEGKTCEPRVYYASATLAIRNSV